MVQTHGPRQPGGAVAEPRTASSTATAGSPPIVTCRGGPTERLALRRNVLRASAGDRAGSVAASVRYTASTIPTDTLAVGTRVRRNIGPDVRGAVAVQPSSARSMVNGT